MFVSLNSTGRYPFQGQRLQVSRRQINRSKFTRNALQCSGEPLCCLIRVSNLFQFRTMSQRVEKLRSRSGASGEDLSGMDKKILTAFTHNAEVYANVIGSSSAGIQDRSKSYLIPQQLFKLPGSEPKKNLFLQGQEGSKEIFVTGPDASGGKYLQWNIWKPLCSGTPFRK